MKKVALILFITIWGGFLFSYSLLERESGNFTNSLDPRSAAMGGASTCGGNRLLDIFSNPANLGFMKGYLGSQFGIGVMKNDDNRSIPMFNFFDGYIDDATYVSNVHYFDEYFGGLYFKKSFHDFSISLAATYRPVVNFDATYNEEVRNDDNSDDDADDSGYSDIYNYPPIIANNFIEGSGSINSRGYTIAFSYKNFISFGYELAFLQGDSELNRELIWTDFARDQVSEELRDSLVYLKRDFSAEEIIIGADFILSKRIGVGCSFAPQIDFEPDISYSINNAGIDTLVYSYEFDENDAVVDSTMFSEYIADRYGTYKIPAKIRLGFSFQPRNIMRTHFNCDVEYVRWSNLNDLFDDEFNFYIGVEHKLNRNLPFRLGFNYQTKYQLMDDSQLVFAEKITMPSFTVGTGFSFMKKFQFDISAEFSNRRYETLDLFMDGQYNYDGLWDNITPQDRGWENPDYVSESFMKVQSTISFNW